MRKGPFLLYDEGGFEEAVELEAAPFLLRLLFDFLESFRRLLFLLEYCLLFNDLAVEADVDGAEVFPPWEGRFRVEEEGLLPEESADVTFGSIFDMAILASELASDFISLAR